MKAVVIQDGGDVENEGEGGRVQRRFIDAVKVEIK